MQHVPSWLCGSFTSLLAWGLRQGADPGVGAALHPFEPFNHCNSAGEAIKQILTLWICLSSGGDSLSPTGGLG